MKKILSLSLVVAILLSLCLCVSAESSTVAAKVVAQNFSWTLNEESRQAVIYRYTPVNFKFRGNSTPVIFVLGDKAWTEESANEALRRGGFDQMAQEESGHVIFVSPSNGTAWTAEDYPLMQALAGNITDNYTYQLEQAGTYDTGVDENGVFYAGRFRLYTFAEGSAQTFVKTYLDTDGATYHIKAWQNASVEGFGAGFGYAEKFNKKDNIEKWEVLRRTNHLDMMNGYTYTDRYSVFADYGIQEESYVFTASDGNTFEYTVYLPEKIAGDHGTTKYPLVLVFHGSNQNPDGYIHLMDWPVLGDKYGFITVSVNAWQKSTNDGNAVGTATFGDDIELLDLLQKTYAVDSARVYATGYSMGGITSLNLGFTYTSRFAAIAPTEATMRIVEPTPSVELPVFVVNGDSDFYPVFPKAGDAAKSILTKLAAVNGFTYDGVYHAELEEYYGMSFDRSYTYLQTPATHNGGGTISIHELDSKTGVPNTVLCSVSKLGHKAFMPSAELIWKFFSQFSRAEDGSSVYTPTAWTDVAKNAWYESAAAFVYRNGYVQGTTASTFSPNGTMTRAMLVQMLYRAAGCPAAASGNSFTDVAPDSWYADAVAWASAEKLVSGCGNGKFCPEALATREQICTILWRLGSCGSGDAAKLAQFKDSSRISAWAKDAMAWGVSAGIFCGNDKGELSPGAYATRAEFAAMLQRFMCT
jgi:poly(3-hydroxybutyrate) depolymerase